MTTFYLVDNVTTSKPGEFVVVGDEMITKTSALRLFVVINKRRASDEASELPMTEYQRSWQMRADAFDEVLDHLDSLFPEARGTHG